MCFEKKMDLEKERQINEIKKKGLSLRLNNDKFLELRKTIREEAEKIFCDKNQADIFYQCFFNTIDTVSHFQEDGTVFVLTGDIPAMWLRDSVPQVMQYLFFAKEDEEVRSYIKGVLQRQFKYMEIDVYANAFKRKEGDYGEWDGTVDSNKMPSIVWERKFELDSLCYPFFLLCKYYEVTKDSSCFDESFMKAFDVMIETVEIEREHSKRSEYYFHKGKVNVGHNNPDSEKGLVWCGFRPSDDPCQYPYHIPDNMFLVSILYKLAPIFEDELKDNERAGKCRKLIFELKTLIEKYGIFEDVETGKRYVSETDCMGNYCFNDDANIPSLLSIPYLEYPYIDKTIYENTRKFILSKRNKYYYEGKMLKGIGSPHTPEGRVWPLSLCMQALTSEDETEIKEILKMLFNSTDGTGYMHEGVDCNDVSAYSRPWFVWANSMFAYMILCKQNYFSNKQTQNIKL